MTNKLLFFDVDGTLYNSQKQLSYATKEAIQLAKENGHIVAIATGRGPFMIEELRRELAIDTFVTYNGQYVVHEGDIIFTDELTKEQQHDIIAFAASRNEPVVFMTAAEMIASVPNHGGIGASLSTLKYPYPRVEADYFKNNPVYQLLLYTPVEQERIYTERFDYVQLVRWHETSCDVLPKAGSKARGIQKLAERLGFSMDDVIAFGDGLNDVEMLQAARIGVCLGNGHEKAKEAADYVVAHVDDEGLSQAMRMLELI
ncbi:Cof-type HAD-IIB family hydrolase [Caryophanon latum]|uniref:Hydrolase Cof n=1 Tax=Caryophanon latum TaxID=33977 RepID=A0A1C0Z2K3_9BACL|nr:Cof-type HAD-IIB family hydrolase [Caryophanon latum]OCS93697.1 hydrolase Cof [Caryophanon latum]